MKPVQRLINQKKTLLNQLQQRVHELNTRTAEIILHLPEAWRDSCQVVRFDQSTQTLVISTSEQNVLTSLRYLQNQLLEQLKKQKHFAALQSIKFIYTPMMQPDGKTSRTPILAKDAAQSCQDAALHCPDELKSALKKLSETLMTKTNSRNNS